MTTKEQIQRVRDELANGGTVCRKCGYRVRGPNHVKGDHHQKPRKITATAVGAEYRATTSSGRDVYRAL